MKNAVGKKRVGRQAGCRPAVRGETHNKRELSRREGLKRGGEKKKRKDFGVMCGGQDNTKEGGFHWKGKIGES